MIYSILHPSVLDMFICDCPQCGHDFYAHDGPYAGFPCTFRDCWCRGFALPLSDKDALVKEGE